MTDQRQPTIPQPDAATLDLLRLCEQSVRPVPAPRYIIERFGPFQAVINREDPSPWLSVTQPIAALDDAPAVAQALAATRAFFDTHQRTLRFEYSAALWPTLGSTLEAAGLFFEESLPLMLCSPAALHPILAPHITIHILTPDDPDDLLGAFQMIRHEQRLDGAAPYAPLRAIDSLRAALRANEQEFALVTRDEQLAGVGVCGLGGELGVAEVVGIVTLPQHRRHGVASSVTSFLVQRLFARGGRLAWLSAENSGAQVAYERVGFHLADYWDSYTAAAPNPSAPNTTP